MHEKKEAASPARYTFTNDTMLSSIKELLVNSRSMLESLENTEVLLAALQPEVIDLCPSPQDAPKQMREIPSDITATEEAAAATTEKAVSPLVGTVTLKEKTRLPSSSSLIKETESMAEECVFIASFQTSRDAVTKMIEMRQRFEKNLECIRQAAEEREKLMALIQEKDTENDELMSLMIEMFEREASMSEQMEGGWYTPMTKQAKIMKREMVLIQARMMEMQSHSV
jgi:hypothetical protein